jgi:hypothetical protein
MTLRNSFDTVNGWKALVTLPIKQNEMEKSSLNFCVLCLKANWGRGSRKRFNREDLELKCRTSTCQQLDKRVSRVCQTKATEMKEGNVCE